MRQIKKLVPKLVSILLCCSMIFPVSAAEPPEEAKVKPLSESAVAEYIAAATETHVAEVNGEIVTYYFGDGFGVAKDSTGYYLARYGTGPFWISINGRMLDVDTGYLASPSIEVPTDWMTFLDTGYQSVDVAGLTATAATLAVQAYMISKGCAKYIGLAATAIGGLKEALFPDGYYITFRFCSKVRIIEIGPSIGEYDDTFTLYAGPGDDKYQNLLVDNHDVYEKPIDGW